MAEFRGTEHRIRKTTSDVTACLCHLSEALRRGLELLSA
jgi:hypothetical protein